ncbi:MAG: hypothetical protein Q9221_007070 [Calogaya cf. arnoldii]
MRTPAVHHVKLVSISKIRMAKAQALGGLGLLTQWLSAAAFVGGIITTEAHYNENETESFSAVGQWSGVAVVVQVLMAAGVSYLWKTLKQRSEANTLGDGTSSTGKTTSVDEEAAEEEWGCRVGYAS